MIVWLASYPRSGNTLFRLMLNRVWGVKSYSIYGDGGDLDNPEMTRLVGHQSFGKSFEQAYPELTADSRVHFVKTHEIPIDAQRAIYIVRDGRLASRSLCEFRKTFHQCDDETRNLRDVIMGFTPFGSWSNHLDAWNPLHRPGTLVVRYEDLANSPTEQIERIGRFTEMKPTGDWRNNFDELSRLEPRFFRAGINNRPESALPAHQQELFWMLHGPWMRRLGYLLADETINVPHIPESFRHTLYHCVADQILRTAQAESRAVQVGA